MLIKKNNKTTNIEDYNNKTNKNTFDFLKKHSNILNRNHSQDKTINFEPLKTFNLKNSDNYRKYRRQINDTSSNSTSTFKYYRS